MKYVFGPVPSRRLGKSLGIDPIPLKTCNWNCVYCQLGRTVPLTNERKEYVQGGEIVAELQQTLAMHLPGAIDWVTFVGSGEPTLHSGLGWLIREVKALTDLPLAVITNGALLYLPEVREDLAAADVVLPSLDAGSSRLYRKINRPWPRLTFDCLLAGLAAFRREFTGLGIITRHPMREEELCTALGHWSPDEVHRTLVILQAFQKAQVIERYGKRFWSAAGARFSQSNLSAELKRKISP